MTPRVDLYDGSYDRFAAEAQEAVRAATYGEDLGQSSWMVADELRGFARLLELDGSSSLLEVGSGSGGPALLLAAETGCRVTGIDVNEFGVRNGERLARERGLDTRVEFRIVDASIALPFADASFDAVFSNDAMCHVPNRAGALREWHRVLRSGGRMLFTDALVVTGLVSHEEIATRSSIGYYCYSPVGENERLIAEAGFELERVEDLTSAAASVSRRWHDARAGRRSALVALEGEENFEGLQRFLWCVHTVSDERRLSRFMYLARRP